MFINVYYLLLLIIQLLMQFLFISITSNLWLRDNSTRNKTTSYSTNLLTISARRNLTKPARIWTKM